MISFIIPIYNAEKYLSACITSLVCQTEKDLQIILVDDGSTDRSLAIAQEWAAKDARLEVYHQPNAGQSAARNRGLKHAKGEYVAFVDADDAISQDWCEKHIAAIKGVAATPATEYRKHPLPYTNSLLLACGSIDAKRLHSCAFPKG